MRRFYHVLSSCGIFAIAAHLSAITATLVPTTEDQPQVLDIDLATFGDQVALIEATLRKEAGGRFSREELLAHSGRISAAQGKFDLSAAAYVMFFKEMGPNHSCGERIGLRLIDSLAPLDRTSRSVSHLAEGPRFNPTWRMGATPSEQRLRQALVACDYVAGFSESHKYRGHALFRAGCIQRALNDWDASTSAWDRCVAAAPLTKAAADALWMGIDNLAWTNRPQQAAERLALFVTSFPHDPRAKSATGLRQTFLIEAGRNNTWFDDSVRSLEAEIKEYSESRSPRQVYAGAAAWL